MPYTIVTIVHILACFFLVLVVLLQTGKGADVGAVFGGSSQTIFGSQGAGDFLTKTTTGIAILFMLTSLFLSYGARQGTGSLFDSVAPVSVPAPEEGEPAGGPAPETESSASEASQTGEESGEGTTAAEPQAAAPAIDEGTSQAETAAPAASQASPSAETVLESGAEAVPETIPSE